MAESDGAVLIDVSLETGDVDKELARLKSRVLKLEETLSFKGARMDNLTKELDAARAKLAELQSAGNTGFLAHGGKLYSSETYQQILSLKSAIQAMEGEHEELNREIGITETQIKAATTRYGELVSQVRRLPPAAKESAGLVDKLEKRIGRLASRVLFFSVITSALRSLRNWFADVIKTDRDAVAAIAQLKGALLTLVQPLVSVVIPVFTAFVQVLAQVVSALASVVSSIMGTTVEKSAEAAENLNDEKKALDGVGASAKKAGKSLASFDEINQLSGGGADGGGGGSSAEIAPDFSFLDGTSERLQEIAKWVLLIGVGFTLWKIGEGLGGALGGLLQKLGGIAIAVGGVALAWDGLKDAWENGVNWGNMAEMIGGVALAALGLGIAFGRVIAGIALVAGGIAMLIAGFHDAMENGWNLQNTLLTIAGILATGLGFFFITGSVIPLVIAAIASLLLAMAVATGHSEELIQGIQSIIQGFLDFFTGIFTGDMEKAAGGINKIFEGLGMAVHAVIDGVRDTFLGFFDWLDKNTGGKFHDIIQLAKDIVNGFFDQVSSVVDGVVLALKGLTKFITGVFTGDWDLAWEGIKDIFKGFINGILAFWVGGVNLIIKALNFLIDKMNTIAFDVPDGIPFVGGRHVGVNLPRIQEYQIPHLATGAVIPPNREFMAVLGDQRNGNNLEAPEDLLRQIVREEAGVDSALLQEIVRLMREGKYMVLDGVTFARLVYESNKSETGRVGESLIKVR